MPKNNSYMASFLLKGFFGIKYKINTLNCQKQNKQLRTKHTKAMIAKNIWDTLLWIVMQNKMLSKIQLPEKCAMFW